MSTYRYSLEELIEAVETSRSIRDSLSKLGLSPAGGNYTTLNNHIKNLNLDTSHFTSQAWNKGKTFTKKPLAYYFTGGKIASHTLRLRLIAEGVKEAKCESCLLTEWQGQLMPLELDHINGYHDDNRLENLRILCPNCHYQTPTHRGKNKARYKQSKKTTTTGSTILKSPIAKPDKLCLCGTILSDRRAKSCRKCVLKQTKIQWPLDEELKELVWSKPRAQLKFELGVSDTAIGKRLRARGIPQPPRGYWAKKAAGKI